MPILRQRAVQIGDALHARPFLWAAVVSAIVAVTCVLTLNPGYQTNDDVGMQSTVDGTAFGQPLPHLVFSNVLIGLLLSSLYRIVGSMPWYGLYLYLAHFAALLALTYATLAVSRRRLGMRLLGLGAVLALFHLTTWMQLQFTSTAILLGSSGVALYLVVSAKHSARPAALAVAGAMVGLVSWIRWDSAQAVWLLALPLIALTLRRIPWQRQALFVGTAALVVLAGVVGQAVYYSGRPEWRAYFEFNAARGYIEKRTQFDPIDPSVVAAVGWSRNDLELYRRWFFTDDAVYQADDLQVVASSLPFAFHWGHAWDALADLGEGWPEGLRLATIAALAGVVWGEGGRRARSVVVLGLLTTGAVIPGLAGVSRLPDHVTVPILAFPALVFLSTSHSRESPAPRRSPASRRWRSVVPLAVFLTAVGVGGADCLRSNRQQPRAAARLERVMGGLESVDPNGLFISWAAQLPLNNQSLSPWQRGGREGPALLPLGWQQRSPMHQAWMAHHGITDLYVAVATREDVYVPIRRLGLTTMYLRFLEEHYGFRALLRPVDRVANFTVFNLAVDYRIDNTAGALVEHRLDDTTVPHYLTGSTEADGVTLLTLGRIGVMIVGRTTGDLVVVTHRDRAVALALPSDPLRNQTGSFGVILSPKWDTFRVFSLHGQSAIEITP